MSDRRLTGIDLNLLVAFDALVVERSVTRAAQRMSIGQPAMSAALGRLRRLFDDPLLVRRGREMVPTPLAESLAAPVHEALSLLEQALASRSRFDPATAGRTFSIIASDYVTLVLLRELLVRFEQESPAVRLHVGPVTPTLRDQLRTGRADLAIVPREVLGEAPELVTSPLFTDRYVCAIGRDNDDIGTAMTLEEFSAQPYLAFDDDPLGSLAERQLDAAGVTRRREVSIESFLLAPYLLNRTRLVALVHERLARIVQDHLAIRVLEPPIALEAVTELMAWSPRHQHDPGHAWLREQLLTAAAAL